MVYYLQIKVGRYTPIVTAMFSLVNMHYNKYFTLYIHNAAQYTQI